jgi:hypothetical protein
LSILAEGELSTAMVVDLPLELKHTLTPCPTEKGKMQAVLTPLPAPLPVPTPPTALPYALAPAPHVPKPKPLASPCALAPAMPSAPPPTSYAKAATSTPMLKYQMRPGPVVYLCQISLTVLLWDIAQTKAPLLVATCNQALALEAQHANI